MDAEHAADEPASLVSDVSYKLEREDGTPAEPPTLRSSVPSWRPGDTIPLGRDCSLLVIDTRLDEDTDGDPVAVLIVEAA
jgi:hypothetical protein